MSILPVILDEGDIYITPRRLIPEGVSSVLFVISIDAGVVQPVLEIGAVCDFRRGLENPQEDSSDSEDSDADSGSDRDCEHKHAKRERVATERRQQRLLDADGLRQYYGRTYTLPPLSPGLYRVSVCFLHGVVTILSPIELTEIGSWFLNGFQQTRRKVARDVPRLLVRATTDRVGFRVLTFDDRGTLSDVKASGGTVPAAQPCPPLMV